MCVCVGSSRVQFSSGSSRLGIPWLWNIPSTPTPHIAFNWSHHGPWRKFLQYSDTDWAELLLFSTQFFFVISYSCPQMSVQKNMFSLLALSTNSVQLKCVYTATRLGKSYRFHRNFISFSRKQTYTHTHTHTVRERKRRPLQSPVHVSQMPCVLWHRLSNTEIECVRERMREKIT